MIPAAFGHVYRSTHSKCRVGVQGGKAFHVDTYQFEFERFVIVEDLQVSTSNCLLFIYFLCYLIIFHPCDPVSAVFVA